MVLDALMTDRTADDLANDTDRVYIAYTDLNRTEQACALLTRLLHIDIRTKKWGMEDFRTDTEVARLLGNIKVLRAAYFIRTNTPVTPAKITYSSVYQTNDIEQMLKDSGDMHDSVVNGQQHLSFKLGARATENRR